MPGEAFFIARFIIQGYSTIVSKKQLKRSRHRDGIKGKVMIHFQKTTLFKVLTALLMVAFYSCASASAGGTQETIDMGNSLISINQLGYYPQSPKYVIIDNSVADQFIVKKVIDDQVVFEGPLTDAGDYDGSRRNIKLGDFSALSEAGEYYVDIPSAGTSYSFLIDGDIYAQATKDALKTFYFQRASMPIDEAFGGEWARSAGHPDDNCRFHESTGKEGTHSSPGGWYDAGDYGKYMVNGGISVSTLMMLHEIQPQAFGDDLNIPETGNGTSDLLDEVKYELDWMKTMQDEDGGAFFKVAGMQWPGFVSPANDRMLRYIIGKSTTSTLNLAASLAQAARVYRDIDSSYAEQCLEQAEQAWDWALANPSVKEVEVNGSGSYGDSNYQDEFLWAAAELYISSGKERFKSYLMDSSLIQNPNISSPAYWGDLRNHAYFSLATRDNGLDDTVIQGIQDEIIAFADKTLDYMAGNPYRIPMRSNDFVWGSNGAICNYGINLAYAYQFTEDEKYRQGILSIINYVFGQNALSFSFVTGYGSDSVKKPHNRIISSNYSSNIIPGFIAGGPNQHKNDNLNYNTDIPEKTYLDVEASYASNETAINWNAPFVFLLGFVSQQS